MAEQRERAINLPWPVLALIAILIGIFAVEARFGVDRIASPWVFIPRDLAQGPYVTALTAIFVHGSWAHVLGNSAFMAAFATPVVRRIGEDALGVVAFVSFFLVCGVLGNLGFAALNPGGLNPVLGASGAIAGMMGAASRLIGQRDGNLAPFNSSQVIAMAAGWLLVNVIFGAVFVGWAPGAGGMPIAWQVHLVGYAAGLLLFAPLLSMIGRRQIDHAIEN